MKFIIQGLDAEGCWSRREITMQHRKPVSTLEAAHQMRRDEIKIGNWLPECVRVKEVE